MKNEIKRENDSGSIAPALPFIGPVLALVCMLVVAVAAATTVMMMM